jgi:hypothetical protein
MAQNGRRHPVSDCRNCDSPLPADARFCPACGQSVRDFSRPWAAVLRELLDELFDVDGRMFVSLKHLLARPGHLSHEFNRGRRKAFTPPLRMYLVISLLFFLVLPSIIPEVPGQLESHRVSVDLYSKGLFVLLPVFALLLKLFYRDAFYFAHLVFTTYLFSFMFIVFGLLMATESWADRYLAVLLLQLVLLAWTLFYFFAALRTNFGGTWARNTLKGLGVLFLFMPILASVIEFASHVRP